MSRTVKEKRARFRELHQSGCFILPNPWDVGSARMLESLGFEALASTSTGCAWSTGRPDCAVTRDDVLEHLTTLANSVNLPLNADFEAGFAPDLEGVAENVSRAIAVGVAGLSIEDRICKTGNYLRIRGGSRKLNANGRTLFANGVRRSVMLFEWPSPSMGLTTFLTMTRFGVSNGSVALATTRACRATPESPSA
jgi:hypothetical protein